MKLRPFFGLTRRSSGPVKRDVSAVVAAASVSEVLELVANGELEADDVLMAELEGKKRKTLLKALSPSA